jgi:hypothetical protein
MRLVAVLFVDLGPKAALSVRRGPACGQQAEDQGRRRSDKEHSDRSGRTVERENRP